MKKISYISLIALITINIPFIVFSENANIPQQNIIPKQTNNYLKNSISHQNNIYQKNNGNKQTNFVSVINNRAEGSLLLEKMKKDILKQLNRKLENNPNNVWMVMLKGWTLNSEGKYNEAIKYFNKGLKIQKISSAYMGLGMAYIRKGDLDKANYYYMKALKQKESGDPYYVEDTKMTAPSLTVKDKDIGNTD